MACDSENTVQTSDYLNYYLASNVNSICRICLEKGTKLMPIFDPIKPPHFSILIMACASVQVIEHDGLPPAICQKCIAKLNLAFQFKTQCENADAKLRQSLANVQLLQDTNNDLGHYIDLKKDDELLLFEDSIENAILSTEDVNIAINVGDNGNRAINIEMEASDVNNEGFNDTNDMHLENIDEPQLQQLENVPLDSGSSVLMAIPMTNENDDVHHSYEIKIEPTISDNSRNKKKKHVKDHKCHICSKVFHTKASLVHHIRIHTGERPYVCHLCDKRFINGGHLHTHMRTHTGEKNHICSACPKAFPTAQQLTKHTIAIHTSERPYSCPYCVKRFASSSNLSTHVKIHTGEKNYYCDQCGKAFSTKGQLYQHMLVHTGEKAFLCEFCEKRFSQKAHLVRHSKMHQKIIK